MAWLSWVATGIYFLVVYTLVAWIGVSLVITRDGPVRWADGWERVVAHYRESLGWGDSEERLRTTWAELPEREAGTEREAED